MIRLQAYSLWYLYFEQDNYRLQQLLIFLNIIFDNGKSLPGEVLPEFGPRRTEIFRVLH